MILPNLFGMLVALLPIIALETFLARRWIQLERPRIFKGVAMANVVSTLVGVPLAWGVMLGLELATTDGSAYVLDSPSAIIKTAVLGAAWLPPPDMGDPAWIFPLASLVLLVPAFFLSVLLERFVLVRKWKTVPKAQITKTVWKINIASYIALVALGAGLFFLGMII